jgi:hypothetical protein
MNATTNPVQIKVARRSPAYWRVTIDNPPINVMGPPMVEQFHEIINALETDEHPGLPGLTSGRSPTPSASSIPACRRTSNSAPGGMHASRRSRAPPRRKASRLCSRAGFTSRAMPKIGSDTTLASSRTRPPRDAVSRRRHAPSVASTPSHYGATATVERLSTAR